MKPFPIYQVMDYKKQHQVALNLYKLYPKTPYFSWAIMSLFAKAEFDSDPSSVLVSLPLAERMMAKFIEDNGIDSEHEICLYLLILLKQVHTHFNHLHFCNVTLVFSS